MEQDSLSLVIADKQIEAFERLSKETIIRALVWATVLDKSTELFPIRVRILKALMQSDIKNDETIQKSLKQIDQQLDREYGIESMLDEKTREKKNIERAIRYFEVLWEKIESKMVEEVVAEL